MVKSPKKSPAKRHVSSQPLAKRAKTEFSSILVQQNGNSAKHISFENRLAKLDVEDGGLHAASTSSGHVSARQPGAEAKWPRPPLAKWLQSGRTDVDLAFQLIDIDFYTERTGVIVRMFGVTNCGNSIVVSVPGYRPYFFASAPLGFDQSHIPAAISLLNSNISISAQSGIPKDAPTMVTDIELVFGSNLFGFHAELRQQLFLKIFVLSPRIITACSRVLYLLEKIGADEVGHLANFRPCQAFEANLDFEVRFMADLGLVGCGWAECPARKFTHVDPKHRNTNCQIEVSINVNDLKVHLADEPQWSHIAPLRTLSFDIECIGPIGTFPDASRDPIIQIANMVKVEGQKEEFVRNCFVVGGCETVVGSDIVECRDEKELLEKWAVFVRCVDPDLLTGYNIQNFDLPYILDRARHLKIDKSVCLLSRVRGAMCRQRDAAMQSKQMGNRVNKLVSMDGRIIFDVLQLVLRDYKLRSYTLNNVSYFFLGEQKEDVSYTFIPQLQNGSDKDRRRLALYCMKDAFLPLRLLDKLMLVINYIEMARVTGCPLNFLVSRGQQVKILSMLLRKTREHHLFLPVVDVAEGGGGDEVGYEGATVIEPLRAFYKDPIATLDFASLYPSIMIAHNLCYTTLLPKGGAKKMPPNWREGEDFIVTPSGDTFVKSSHRQGLLPKVLEELLSARKRAKAELKNEKDPFRQMVLNGRQLALKVSANSVYGFTGASRGKLPCLEISQSVTAFGRQMIEATKQMVEEHYVAGAVDGLCPANAKVIYGDTDSVMVKFGVKSVGEAMELGRHAAREISKRFPQPIQLEFEKVYHPYLLVNKKRYAGLYWTKEERHDKMDCKGLETVRRDNCQLVSLVLNTCLEKLLIDRDDRAAIGYAKKVISELLCGHIDISMLIISKELTKKGEKYVAKQAHVELAERMRKRDPGSAPRLGDRVPYVIVNRSGGGVSAPAYEKAEDPTFVLQNNIPIDFDYYLEHQLVKPLARILDPVMGDQAEKLLISGEHTKKKARTKLKSGMMAGYFSKKAVCLGCKTRMDFEEEEAPAACEQCQPRIDKIYLEQILTMRQIEHKFSRLWTECQNCAETLQSEIFCSARDCPIFYMREKNSNSKS
uniref:DNA polymerase n=1 Tax=Globodera rostochiensis TaxID=31243 RepID=A0A914HJ83_GLORO